MDKIHENNEKIKLIIKRKSAWEKQREREGDI